MSEFDVKYTLAEERNILNKASELRTFAVQYQNLINEVRKVRLAMDAGWNSSSGAEWKHNLELWADGADKSVENLVSLAAAMEQITDDHHGLIEGLVDIFK